MLGASWRRPGIGLLMTTGSSTTWSGFSSAGRTSADDPVRASTLAERAVTLGSKESRNWHNLGVARYRIGDTKEPSKRLERAASLRKDDDSSDWLMLAMAHWKHGDKDQAMIRYNRAVETMEKTGWDNDEPCRFRDEASALLGLANLPADVFAPSRADPSLSQVPTTRPTN